MTTNVEVKKSGNENIANVIRRFTRRVQGAGILPRVKSLRYYKRPASKTVRKRQRLKSLERKAQFEEQAKLGKVVETKRRFGRR